MLRLLIPLGLLLLVDLYFFQIIKTAGGDLASKWRTILFIAYWLVSLLTIFVVVYSNLRESWPNHIKYYLFSIMLMLFIPKLFGVIFLLGEDVFRFGKGVIGLFGSTSFKLSTDGGIEAEYTPSDNVKKFQLYGWIFETHLSYKISAKYTPLNEPPLTPAHSSSWVSKTGNVLKTGVELFVAGTFVYIVGSAAILAAGPLALGYMAMNSA